MSTKFILYRILFQLLCASTVELTCKYLNRNCVEIPNFPPYICNEGDICVVSGGGRIFADDVWSDIKETELRSCGEMGRVAKSQFLSNLYSDGFYNMITPGEGPQIVYCYDMEGRHGGPWTRIFDIKGHHYIAQCAGVNIGDLGLMYDTLYFKDRGTFIDFSATEGLPTRANGLSTQHIILQFGGDTYYNFLPLHWALGIYDIPFGTFKGEYLVTDLLDRVDILDQLKPCYAHGEATQDKCFSQFKMKVPATKRRITKFTDYETLNPIYCTNNEYMLSFYIYVGNTAPPRGQYLEENTANSRVLRDCPERCGECLNGTTCYICSGTNKLCPTSPSTELLLGSCAQDCSSCQIEIESQPRNTYQTGQICKVCHNSCVTCIGPNKNNCESCPSGEYICPERLGGAHGHCVSSCTDCNYEFISTEVVGSKCKEICNYLEKECKITGGTPDCSLDEIYVRNVYKRREICVDGSWSEIKETNLGSCMEIQVVNNLHMLDGYYSIQLPNGKRTITYCLKQGSEVWTRIKEDIITAEKVLLWEIDDLQLMYDRIYLVDRGNTFIDYHTTWSNRYKYSGISKFFLFRFGGEYYYSSVNCSYCGSINHPKKSYNWDTQTYGGIDVSGNRVCKGGYYFGGTTTLSNFCFSQLKLLVPTNTRFNQITDYESLSSNSSIREKNEITYDIDAYAGAIIPPNGKFILYDSTNTFIIADCPPQCKICINATGCTICKGTNKLCPNSQGDDVLGTCEIDCNSCQIPINTIQRNTYLRGNSCKVCDISCETCSGHNTYNCKTCPSGKYLCPNSIGQNELGFCVDDCTQCNYPYITTQDTGGNRICQAECNYLNRNCETTTGNPSCTGKEIYVRIVNSIRKICQDGDWSVITETNLSSCYQIQKARNLADLEGYYSILQPSGKRTITYCKKEEWGSTWTRIFDIKEEIVINQSSSLVIDDLETMYDTIYIEDRGNSWMQLCSGCNSNYYSDGINTMMYIFKFNDDNYYYFTPVLDSAFSFPSSALSVSKQGYPRANLQETSDILDEVSPKLCNSVNTEYTGACFSKFKMPISNIRLNMITDYESIVGGYEDNQIQYSFYIYTAITQSVGNAQYIEYDSANIINIHDCDTNCDQCLDSTSCINCKQPFKICPNGNNLDIYGNCVYDCSSCQTTINLNTRKSFQKGNVCVFCDSTCETCSGPSSLHCKTCPVGKVLCPQYPGGGEGTCITDCSSCTYQNLITTLYGSSCKAECNYLNRNCIITTGNPSCMGTEIYVRSVNSMSEICEDGVWSVIIDSNLSSCYDIKRVNKGAVNGYYSIIQREGERIITYCRMEYDMVGTRIFDIKEEIRMKNSELNINDLGIMYDTIYLVDRGNSMINYFPPGGVNNQGDGISTQLIALKFSQNFYYFTPINSHYDFQTLSDTNTYLSYPREDLFQTTDVTTQGRLCNAFTTPQIDICYSSFKMTVPTATRLNKLSDYESLLSSSDDNAIIYSFYIYVGFTTTLPQHSSQYIIYDSTNMISIAQCPLSCKECLAPNECINCQETKTLCPKYEGSMLVGSCLSNCKQCLIQGKYTFDNKGVCQACHASCEKCSGTEINMCISCAPGKYLCPQTIGETEGSCVESCAHCNYLSITTTPYIGLTCIGMCNYLNRACEITTTTPTCEKEKVYVRVISGRIEICIDGTWHNVHETELSSCEDIQNVEGSTGIDGFYNILSKEGIRKMTYCKDMGTGRIPWTRIYDIKEHLAEGKCGELEIDDLGMMYNKIYLVDKGETYIDYDISKSRFLCDGFGTYYFTMQLSGQYYYFTPSTSTFLDNAYTFPPNSIPRSTIYEKTDVIIDGRKCYVDTLDETDICFSEFKVPLPSTTRLTKISDLQTFSNIANYNNRCFYNFYVYVQNTPLPDKYLLYNDQNERIEQNCLSTCNKCISRSECLACNSGYILCPNRYEGNLSSCMNTCIDCQIDYLSMQRNTYLDGNICRICHISCLTCSGGLRENCRSCSGNLSLCPIELGGLEGQCLPTCKTCKYMNIITTQNENKCLAKCGYVNRICRFIPETVTGIPCADTSDVHVHIVGMSSKEICVNGVWYPIIAHYECSSCLQIKQIQEINSLPLTDGYYEIISPNGTYTIIFCKDVVGTNLGPWTRIYDIYNYNVMGKEVEIEIDDLGLMYQRIFLLGGSTFQMNLDNTNEDWLQSGFSTISHTLKFGESYYHFIPITQNRHAERPLFEYPRDQLIDPVDVTDTPGKKCNYAGISKVNRCFSQFKMNIPSNSRLTLISDEESLNSSLDNTDTTYTFTFTLYVAGDPSPTGKYLEYNEDNMLRHLDCGEGCEECIDENKCIKCLDTWKLCPTMTYGDYIGVCKINCSICQIDLGSKHMNTFELLLVCEACDETCLTCSGPGLNKCLSCKESYLCPLSLQTSEGSCISDCVSCLFDNITTEPFENKCNVPSCRYLDRTCEVVTGDSSPICTGSLIYVRYTTTGAREICKDDIWSPVQETQYCDCYHIKRHANLSHQTVTDGYHSIILPNGIDTITYCTDIDENDSGPWTRLFDISMSTPLTGCQGTVKISNLKVKYDKIQYIDTGTYIKYSDNDKANGFSTIFSNMRWNQHYYYFMPTKSNYKHEYGDDYKQRSYERDNLTLKIDIISTGGVCKLNGNVKTGYCFQEFVMDIPHRMRISQISDQNTLINNCTGAEYTYNFQINAYITIPQADQYLEYVDISDNIYEVIDCPAGCAECSDALNCAVCETSNLLCPVEEGGYLGTCIEECTQCQIQAQSTYQGTKKCLKCDENCLTCTAGTNTDCTQCENYLCPNAEGGSVGSCVEDCIHCLYPQTTYLSTTGVCLPCDISCNTCTEGGADACTLCKIGSSFCEIGEGLGICVSFCTSECQINNLPTFDLEGICHVCDVSCDACASSTANSCIRCQVINFFCESPFNSGDGSCVLDCSSCLYLNLHTFEEGDKCTQCDESCEECSAATSADCISCKAGKVLCPSTPGSSSGSCEVDCNSCVIDGANSFLFTSTLCKECNSGCARCSGWTINECSECGSSEKVCPTDPNGGSVGSCVSDCGACTYSSGSLKSFLLDPPGILCKKCYSTCETCRDTESADCLTCQSSLSLCIEDSATTSGQCVNSCHTDCIINAKKTYLENSENTCHECDESCEECSAATFAECISCETGKVLCPSTPGSSSGSCEDDCNSCVIDGTNSFLFNSTHCKECNSGCLICSGEAANECTECPSTEKLCPIILGGSVGPCVSDCQSCIFPGNLQSFLSPSGKLCKECDSTCQTCENSGFSDCLSCKGTDVFCEVNIVVNSGFCVSQGSSCSSCPTGQVLCPSTSGGISGNCENNCHSCQIGSLNTFPKIFKCEECDIQCATCSGPGADNCTLCLGAEILCPDTHGSSSGSCQTDCSYCIISGDYSFPVTSSLCKECDSTCHSCSGSLTSQCTECREPNKVCPLSIEETEGNCVASCTACTYNAGTQNSFLDGALCKDCYTSCLTCGGRGILDCLSCKQGYNLCIMDPLTSSGKCIETCNTDCQIDSSNTYLNTNDGICHACDSTCGTCRGTDYSDCLTCKSSGSFCMINIATNSGQCITTCSTHCLINYKKTYLDNNENKCHECDENCEECSAATSVDCISCKTGNVLCPSTPGSFSGSCEDDCNSCVIDGANSFLFASTLCKECNSGCARCSGWTINECSECGSSEKVCPTDPNGGSVGSCVSDCGACTYSSGSLKSFLLDPPGILCKKCYSTCETCRDTESADCLTCQSSLSLCIEDSATTSGQCVNSCHTDCIINYRHTYRDLTSLLCHECDIECKTCNTGTNTSCTSCPSDKFLCANESGDIEGKCVENCFNDCQIDSKNTYIDGTTCNMCDSTCLECTGTTDVHCITCPTNQYLCGVTSLTPPITGKCTSDCENTCVISNYHTFLPHTTATACAKCDITCRECVDVNANSCTKCVSDALCPINEIANVGRCLPCSSCYIDLTPTYLDTLPPVICRKCHHYCQECNSYSNQLEPSLCEQCLSSPGIINSTGICECDITSGYMEVVENGKTVCITCHPLCSECFGSTWDQCSTCKPGNTSPRVNQCRCPQSQYFDSQSQSCIQCYPMCTECTDGTSTACSACYPDAYLEGNTCKCRPGYLFFQPTKQCVIYCSPGYYREETNICTLCPQNCQLCDYHDKCLLCDTFLVNFVHLTDIYLECLEICPTGYYADSDQNCQKCHPNCKSCFGVSSTECAECNNEYLLIGWTCDQTECPNLTYQDNQECIPCDKKCSDCTESAIICHQCAANYYLTKKEYYCTDTCDIGYLNFNLALPYQCLRCPNHCVNCSIENAEIFEIGDGTVPRLRENEPLIDLLNLKCSICSNNYFESPLGTCVDGGNIQIQFPNSYPNITTWRIENCHLACNGCIGSLDIHCLYCAIGFVFNAQDPPQCLKFQCTIREYIRIDLAHRYFCELCHERCGSCTGPGPSNCLTCSDLYIYNQTAQSCQTYSEYHPGYKDKEIPNQSLQEVCGDGRNMFILPCDDGNSIDGDGCSSSCQVEDGFKCSGGSFTNPDTCIEIIPPSLLSLTQLDTQTVIITFSEAVYIHLLNETENVLDLFIFGIIGEADSYPFHLENLLIRQEPHKVLRVEIEFLCSLYGNEYLKVTLNSTKEINDLVGNEIINSVLTQKLLPYEYVTEEDKKNADSSSKSSQIVVITTLITALLINVAFNAPMEGLWGLINILQLISYTILIPIRFPKNLLIFLQAIALVHGYNQFIPNIFGYLVFDEELEENSFNSCFESRGFRTRTMILLIGSDMTLLLFMFLLIPLVILLKKKLKSKMVKFILQKIDDRLRFRIIIRSLITGFLRIAMATFLNFGILQFRTFSEVFTSLLCIFFMIFVILIPSFLSEFLFRNHKLAIENENFQKKYDTLIEEFAFTKGIFQANYYPVWVFRRVIYAAILIFCQGNPIAQLILIQLSNIFMMLWIIATRPFRSRWIFASHMISEVAFFLYAMTLFPLFSVTVSSDRRSQIGNYIMYYLIGTIVVVWILFVISQIYLFCSNKIGERKKEEMKKKEIKDLEEKKKLEKAEEDSKKKEEMREIASQGLLLNYATKGQLGRPKKVVKRESVKKEEEKQKRGPGVNANILHRALAKEMQTQIVFDPIDLQKALGHYYAYQIDHPSEDES